MKVKIDRYNNFIQLDTTGGSLGPVPTAGHVATALASHIAFKGWLISFYPENNEYTFEGGIELNSNLSYSAIADKIIKLINTQLSCKECGREYD